MTTSCFPLLNFFTYTFKCTMCTILYKYPSFLRGLVYRFVIDLLKVPFYMPSLPRLITVPFGTMLSLVTGVYRTNLSNTWGAVRFVQMINLSSFTSFISLLSSATDLFSLIPLLVAPRQFMPLSHKSFLKSLHTCYHNSSNPYLSPQGRRKRLCEMYILIGFTGGAPLLCLAQNGRKTVPNTLKILVRSSMLTTAAHVRYFVCEMWLEHQIVPHTMPLQNIDIILNGTPKLLIAFLVLDLKTSTRRVHFFYKWPCIVTTSWE